jgi:tetratricopeptide (TPR) repeat protein
MMRQSVRWPAVLAILVVSVGLGLAWMPITASSADRTQTGTQSRAMSRAEAVKSLAQPAALARMQGAIRLAEIGTMPDADLLAARLHDDDARVREVAAAAMWQIWGRSGDKAIDAQYQRAIKLMESRQLDEAVTVFSDIIKKQPTFAEAWNKRATLYYMQGQFDLSLQDCDEVLKRNQNHFGALSGYGQIYIQKRDYRRAIQYLQRALKVNPNQPGTADTIELLEEKLQEQQRKTT